VELIMIRPDTLAEGLKVTQPEMLFSPLALPDINVKVKKNGKEGPQVTVRLDGVALFDRKRRATEYKHADSGYISAWYLDEDYDGDCFVDCQMFFDFKKAPNLRAALKADIEPDEYRLQVESRPFPVRGYKRIAVKVEDVFGNESTVVKDLQLAGDRRLRYRNGRGHAEVETLRLRYIHVPPGARKDAERLMGGG
jgi:hypothetical protein